MVPREGHGWLTGRITQPSNSRSRNKNGDSEKEVLHMKRNLILIAASIFLITVLVLITHNWFPKTIEHKYFLLQMKGEAQNWRVEDYQVAITPNFSAAGSAKVYYLGDLGRINNEIQVEFYNDFFASQIVGAYSTGIGAIGDNGYFETGGGGLSDNAQNITLQEIGRTYAVITWNDKGNQQHSEIIQLEIDNRFVPK